MSSAMKRSSGELALPPKRSRGTEMGRLVDLRGAPANLFANAFNATRARERGYLRSRDASGKYEEVCADSRMPAL